MSERRVEGYEGISKVENAVVYGLEESIRRAKFPMSVDTSKLTDELTNGIKSLAQSKQGQGHDQWLTGVIVQFDLTISNKMWVEMERYHFVDFVSSQSTMHKISKFDLETAYNPYVDPEIVSIMTQKVIDYNNVCEALEMFDSNPMSTEDIDTLVELKTEKYLEILYSNAAGCNITAGLTTNYRQLKTIYSQRKNHRLPEWREFCEWIETLPDSFLITGGEA